MNSGRKVNKKNIWWTRTWWISTEESMVRVRASVISTRGRVVQPKSGRLCKHKDFSDTACSVIHSLQTTIVDESPNFPTLRYPPRAFVLQSHSPSHHMDASSTTTMVSDPATDPVESLRAAALSTLKAKRRKPPPEKPAAPIPSRPPPPSDSFQLDYGFGEDNIPDVLMADSVLPNPPPSEKVAKAPVADEEGQSREEGEISEEEEPPPLFKQPTAPPIRKPSRSPKPVKTATTPEPEKVAEKKLSTPTPEPAPSYKPPTTEVQPPLAPAPTLMERISEPVPYMSVLEQEQEPSDFPMELISEPELNPSFSLLDSDHVRPGLSLTQDEYDTVKDIILDLLGWGVPFDHLVESGLSREILHYVFTELNLRLPDTFDTSGIIPYTPETFGQLQQSVLMPPPPIPEKRRTSVDSETLPAVDTSTRSTTPPSTTTSIPTSDSPFGSDLHDMERLRRQELMARKAAVQASRKLKHSTSAESSTDSSHVLSPDKEDVIKGPVVPTEAVEDFLKSIGSVQVLEAPAAVVAPPPEPKQPSNEMDVDRTPEDEQIVERDARKGDPSQYNALDYSFAEPPPSSAEPPPSSSEAPPTSVGSTTTTFSQSSDQTLVTPSSDQIITPQRVAPRRGTKRPVASDFVDFDPAPRRHDSTSRIERSNGPVHASGITRRLTTGTSFHNIGGSRRCVIDLSDSEDDGEGYPQALQPSFEDQVWLRRDNNKRGRISKYPSPAPLRPTSSSSNNMSPAALAQKELEIRKMRELIAQREEETRLKKLAMARSNPETRPPSTTQNHSASLKQEEVDVVMSSVTEESSNDSLVTKNGRHSESATPPPSNGDSRFSPPGFSKGINESPESPTADGTDSAGANQLDRKSVQDQGKSSFLSRARICDMLSPTDLFTRSSFSLFAILFSSPTLWLWDLLC
ncbi:hypothetical protein BDZ97DRAFT_816608 [Flammula alnicola]|nr:hypothetical protein BDZ97DRAFT_816608 [Flammula alnicola]